MPKSRLPPSRWSRPQYTNDHPIISPASHSTSNPSSDSAGYTLSVYSPARSPIRAATARVAFHVTA